MMSGTWYVFFSSPPLSPLPFLKRRTPRPSSVGLPALFCFFFAPFVPQVGVCLRIRRLSFFHVFPLPSAGRMNAVSLSEVHPICARSSTSLVSFCPVGKALYDFRRSFFPRLIFDRVLYPCVLTLTRPAFFLFQTFDPISSFFFPPVFSR